MELDLNRLPIPDWGLTCPRCGYLLRGLPAHRCPECGVPFSVPDLVRTWTRLRAPLLTGRERPVPDLGLTCAHCGLNLAGLPGDICTCGADIRPCLAPPAAEWFVINEYFAHSANLHHIESLLQEHLVPDVRSEERSLKDLYTGPAIIGSRLRVPSEFYYDVLALLRQAEWQAAEDRARAPLQWVCAACAEQNPGTFDVCWKCGAERP